MAVMELWRRRDLEGTAKPEYIDGNFFTQDSVGNLVGVKVYKDGAEATLTGSVTGYCVLPSGETVSVAGTRSGNQASILVPQSALAYTGPLGITLKLVDGNTITTLMSIIVVVYRSKTDTVITPSSQIITDWANQISAALQEVEDASAAQDEKIDDLKSAKINRPLTNPNGTNGQLLRTLGNGNTQWVDYGLPTDTQTATAVTAWLNAHPEATTTVQDWSLTYNKLVKGTLGFVTPEMFGAVGDGITDDTTAIENATSFGLPIIGEKRKKYKITTGMTLSGVILKSVHFYADSKAELTAAIVLTNCNIESCIFESVNNKPSPWNGSAGTFSNIIIVGKDSSFRNCIFESIEWLSVEDVTGKSKIIDGCSFKNCASGVIGNNATNVYISNCHFDMLEYAGEFEHTIYVSNDCVNWVIENIVSKGCKYYPIHLYNSHDGENPKNIIVENSFFYDSVWCIANIGELKIKNCYFDNSNGNIERYLYALGKTAFIDCDINCSSMLFILTGDRGISFDNCSISCDNIIGAWGTETSGKILLTIKNCVINAKKISDFNRSFELKSYNNVYESYIRLVDNSVDTVNADLFFKGDIFSGAGDIVYAYHFNLTMLDCFINYDSPRLTIASRSTTSGNTAFLSNNTAKASGNYITYVTGITNAAKNNCFNINP